MKKSPIHFPLHKGLVFFLLFFFISEISIAQYKYNLKDLATDSESFINQPANWQRNDWLSFIGTAGLTYGAMHLDGFVREIVLENHEYKNTIPIEFGRIWGEPYSTLALGGSLYIHGLATDNKSNKKIGFEIGESALFTSIITIILKYSLGRERPRENSNPFSFHPFSFKNDNFLSLSSGHTALAFSLSTVLANNTENNYLKAIFYIPAFMTAFSRVYQNHHWTSDVILGGIIGFSVAKFVTQLHNSKSSSNNANLILQKPINLIDLRIPLY